MIDRFEHSPWDFWRDADASAHVRQLALQRELLDAHAGWSFGNKCFVSELAAIDNSELVLGDRTYVAAGAYLTGSLTAGADCSINPYTVIRGDVTLGDGVRIGAHTSILGFNHTMSDPDLPVFRQPLTSKGIRLGNDVWVGSHVVILDGVTVGDHTVLAAGAVVTKDVPDGAIVGGNPAKFLRWRIPPADAPVDVAVTGIAQRVTRFGETVRADATAILDRSWDGSLFVDRPGATPTVRAQADAIEIADLLLGTAPPQLPTDAQVARLRGWQDAGTGAVARLGSDVPASFDDPDVAYHVESVGYALDLLGSEFAHPLSFVTSLSAADVVAFCERLPWSTDAWNAGHWVDALGTAMHWNRELLQPGAREALFGWLLTNASAETGMWGSATAEQGLLLPVNGFYRTTRGTFAQFRMPLPYPERVIDTVLTHAQDARFFSPGMHNACNVLDVAHPLWLTRETGYRAPEVTELARRLLDLALTQWVPGEGFGFHEPGDSPESIPGLQGTEMWLAITWYLADLSGVAAHLGYQPRGIHNPYPA